MGIPAAPVRRSRRACFASPNASRDALAGTEVFAFALDPGLVRTAMTGCQLKSEAGRNTCRPSKWGSTSRRSVAKVGVEGSNPFARSSFS
jgi:hypothetical protein